MMRGRQETFSVIVVADPPHTAPGKDAHFGGQCSLRRGVMAIDWKSGTCLVWILLGPLSVGAATPMVAANTGTALALKSDGTIAAWGRNDYGQLGNGQAAIRV